MRACPGSNNFVVLRSVLLLAMVNEGFPSTAKPQSKYLLGRRRGSEIERERAEGKKMAKLCS